MDKSQRHDASRYVKRGAVIMNGESPNPSVVPWGVELRRASAQAKQWSRRHFEFTIMVVAFFAMTAAYVIVFQVARNESLATSIGAGVRSICAVLPIAILVRYCIRGPVRKLSLPSKVLAHIALACIASLAWYTLVLFLRNWTFDWMQSGVTLTPFSQKASLWYLYQGLVVYAALVAAGYAFLLRSEIEEFQKAAVGRDRQDRTGIGLIFVKSGDEMIRLRHDDIVQISADNDCVTIHTRQRTYISSRNLKDLDRDLQTFGFVRIHRSHLVNLAMVRSAEPTGDGRLSVHLINNATLVSSRAGGKRFRDIIAL
ncbi:MAG: LytTR family DNA-binding domain-containing protein [Pseudomonadota bacterium]